jgi:type I site-specific restriction endonuclease
MDTWMWVVLVLVALIVVVGAWIAWQRQRTDRLKERFGPEYDRTVAESDKREAEKELLEREKRHEELELQPLSSGARERFQAEWASVQARFVDDPEGAVRAADGLVARVMEERGYPSDGDADQRAADLSVEHSGVVGQYRRGHALLGEVDDADDATENLRQAMKCFRTAFEELLEERETVTR